MIILWEDRYKVGNSEIDVQHQELFGLINEFLAADGTPALTACAMRLFKYTRKHFAFEEAIMNEIGYPDVSHHVDQHNILISRLNSIAEDIASDTLDKASLTSFPVVGCMTTLGSRMPSWRPTSSCDNEFTKAGAVPRCGSLRPEQ